MRCEERVDASPLAAHELRDVPWDEAFLILPESGESEPYFQTRERGEGDLCGVVGLRSGARIFVSNRTRVVRLAATVIYSRR